MNKKARVRFHDQSGAICGSERLSVIRIPEARPLHERGADVRVVTCKKCARKLNEWGFALQSFLEVVKDAMERR